MRTVAVFGTFDTKGEEYAYLIAKLRERNVDVISIDLGTMRQPPFQPTIDARAVARAAGEDFDQIHERLDRAACLATMARGATLICRELVDAGKIDGIMAMGGGQGTFLACLVMREMPIGIPKLILSTSATIPEGAATFDGINDTMIMNSLVDVAGINPIICTMMERCAGAMVGMLGAPTRLPKVSKDVRRVAISMWGVTTPCVTRICEQITRAGCEAYVFHATGLGGRIMENLSVQGFFSGIADITMPEISIPLIGGEYPVIPWRLLKAGETGIPRVISVGGVDMVRFAEPFQIPKRFDERAYYMHNPEQRFVRSSVEENEMVGKEIANRLNQSKGRVRVFLPHGGISDVDKPGNSMYDPAADNALFDAIRGNLSPAFEVIDCDEHINDPAFADRVAQAMIQMLK